MRVFVFCAVLVFLPFALSADPVYADDDPNRKMCMVLLHKALEDRTVSLGGLKMDALKKHDLRLPAFTSRLINRGQPTETFAINCLFSYTDGDKRRYLHLLHSGETLVVVRMAVDAVGTTVFP